MSPPRVDDCTHPRAEATCNDDRGHYCPECGGEVPCAEVGPDLCEYEAVRADQTERIVEFLRKRAFKGPIDDDYADLIEQEFGTPRSEDDDGKAGAGD